MQNSELTSLLLDWFTTQGRDLPWRHRGGAHADPYHVLISEFMLQQTTVQTVIPYFYRFMERFPNAAALADASQEEIYHLWQGLGYYSRARSLHKTAQEITNTYSGKIPDNREQLLKLPGVGPYTAAAVLSLGYNQPEAIIDGNVIRVISRLFALTEPVDKTLPIIREKAAELTSPDHAADYASAIMDLGATVCTPKNPSCDVCPWNKYCLAQKIGLQDQIPVITKLVKKEKTGRVYLITNSAGKIFIRKRPGKGLLSGLYELPWFEGDESPFHNECVHMDISVTHVFTHFKLVLNACQINADEVQMDGQFVKIADLGKYPTSTLMKKVFKAIKLHQ
jgi:A/G-specific adenine glycosylase